VPVCQLTHLYPSGADQANDWAENTAEDDSTAKEMHDDNPDTEAATNDEKCGRVRALE